MTVRWNDPTDDQIAAWRAWLAERPAHVRAVAERFDPWTMYRLKSTGQRARFVGCDVGALNCDEAHCHETDTCCLPSGHEGDHDVVGRVTARCYIEHAAARMPDDLAVWTQVFGIDPDDLAVWTEADESAVS